ncbi:hypothetical protein CRENBAI_016402 [Crenichthys baileyi]|uniref:Ig-like domain-containing protein n=1 Tax=Crenichthys baileyi TaxID=28760 RepID=A0AAV9QZL4_9TELE
MVVFFILLLQFTGALSRDEDLLLCFTVRAGDDVTLPCKNVVAGHSNCDTTTWIYSKPRQTVELINLGQVKHTRSDRLSVSADCSLVLKKVTAEDVGLYTCRQFIFQTQSGPDARVHLTLLTLTEHQDQDSVTLSCSVLTDGQCKHRVKWLFKGKDVDKENRELNKSSSSCSAAVTFRTSHFSYTSRFNLFSCEVKTGDEVQLFTFSSRPSDKEKTTVTSSGTPKLEETPDNKATDLMWLYIILPLVLVPLVTAVVVFVLLKKSKGNKTEKHSTDAPTLRPAGAASENQQHEVELENGASYASISFTNTKKSNNSTVKHKDEFDTVTYSTVKTSSPDPSSLYASIK